MVNALIRSTFNSSFFRPYPIVDSQSLVPSPVSHPIYHVSSASLVPGIDDKTLSLIVPLISYWTLSLFFYVLDSDVFHWAAKYRIHEPDEVETKNLASRKDVFLAVILQQVVQTAMGLIWLENSPENDAFRNHTDEMKQLSKWVARFAVVVMGNTKGKEFLAANGQGIISWLYWWGIPVGQFASAIFVIDTWEYFIHRTFHLNKTLYKYIHSVHHRLQAPYAYGALYSHPVEGFFLDTLGSAVAQALTFMTVRQAMLLFAFNTFKTIDDHSGYVFPWDPLQAFFGNNAEYHNIHHQALGIKSNFSQLYFKYWDDLLGTRMTRNEMDVRRRRKGKDADAKTQ